MKTLREYIAESFASSKMSELAKKHGKINTDSAFGMFNFFHDRGTGVSYGKLYSAVIPLLTDEDLVQVFDKYYGTGAVEHNVDLMAKWLRENVDKNFFANRTRVSGNSTGADIASNPDMLVAMWRRGYYWAVFSDGVIALFHVTDKKRAVKCQNAVSELTKKISAGRGKQ